MVRGCVCSVMRGCGLIKRYDYTLADGFSLPLYQDISAAKPIEFVSQCWGDDSGDMFASRN